MEIPCAAPRLETTRAAASWGLRARDKLWLPGVLLACPLCPGLPDFALARCNPFRIDSCRCVGLRFACDALGRGAFGRLSQMIPRYFQSLETLGFLPRAPSSEDCSFHSQRVSAFGRLEK